MNGPQDALAQAIAQHRAGRIDQAAAAYRALLAALPDDPHISFLLGTAELQRGQYAESIRWLKRALERSPDQEGALTNLSVALRLDRRLDEALAAIDRSIALNPASDGKHINRGNVLHDMRRLDDALAAFDRAAALAPANPETHNGRGVVLKDLGRPEEALIAYDRTLALQPNHAEAVNNRGVVLKALHRFDEARTAFDRALALRPNYLSALQNKAILELLLGNFATGWELYEKRRNLPQMDRDASTPRWNGEPLADKTLLILAEQGVGDMVQASRYVPLLIRRDARVVIQAQQPLLPLLKSLKADCDLIAKGDPLPPCDAFCAAMSLPRAFAAAPGTIPIDIPYLFADPARQAAWRARLGKKTSPRVGIAWQGNPEHENDLRRSMPLRYLEPLLRLPFDFHALAKDISTADAVTLRTMPMTVHADGLHDFADTAALIAELDLVVTVDTAVAHVSGALGKPVWILLPHLPDWRWLLGRDDSPWYPTARLFRQPSPGDWASVIEAVEKELTRL